MTQGEVLNPDANRPVLLTTHLIGDVNRSRVLQALVDHGPLSRAELARLAGVPRATMGTIVQGLLDAALLEEGEHSRDGRVGKPARPLWFAPRAGLSVAVAFDDEAVRGALITARGERVTDVRLPLATSDAKPKQLLAAVEKVIRSVLPNGEPVVGIGIAVPGVCNTQAGEVVGSGQLPGAVGTALTRAMADAFGLPVLVDNDARAQALGEKWFGDGRGTATFASLQTGTGLGVGVVLDGRLFRGEDGRVGELGHTQVVADGAPCRCGLRGCWETVATLRWLRAEAARKGLAGAADATSSSLSALGSPAANDLLEEYAQHLGAGLSTLVNLLGIRRVIAHGDIVGGGEPMRRRVEAAMAGASLGYLRDEVRLVFSELDTDATVVGAAALVLSETFRLAA